MDHMIAATSTDEEIRAVVFNMDHTKAPRPDQVGALFCQQAWRVCGLAVCSMVHDQMRHPDISEELAQSCVVFIPKNHPPMVI